MYSTDASRWGRHGRSLPAALSFPGVSHHLDPVPDVPEDEASWFEAERDQEPLRRPVWWRWVAVVLVFALVVATPFAYALYRLLR